MICIYHSRDFDGFCSAAIVKRKYPDAKFIGWDYGMPIPELPEGEPITMVDISFPMDVMQKVFEKSKSMLWIDHHISAINDYIDFERDKKERWLAVIDSSKAACELTWDFFFGEETMPNAVFLLGVYDTWRLKDDPIWNEEVIPFQYGMKAVCNSFETFPALFLNNFDTTKKIYINNFIAGGKEIIRYERIQNEGKCNLTAFKREFVGLKAICINENVPGSRVFDSVWSPEKYDIMISFCYTGKDWRVSLYTEKPEIDVSEICKKYGGGGHKGAAGFITHDISLITGN